MRFLSMIVLVLLLPALARAGDEAKRGGKTVSQWLEQLQAKDARQRLDAIQFLGDFGPDAKAAALPLSNLLKDGDVKVRTQAALSLGRIGPAAKEAIGELLVAAKDADADVSLSAMAALGNMGPAAKEAVPGLVAIARLRNENKALASLAALGRIGVADKEVVALLTQTLDDADLRFRYQAALALADLDLGQEPVRAGLVKALKDKSTKVFVIPLRLVPRWREAGAMPAGTKAALLHLLLKNKEAPGLYRLAAAEAVGPLLALEDLPAYRGALDDRDPLVALQVAAVVGERTGKMTDSLPILLKGLQQEEAGIRAHAVRAMSVATGAERAMVVEPLQKALKDASPMVRRDAAVALMRVTSESNAMKELVAQLDHKQPNVRGEAAGALGQLGGKAGAALADLRKHLQKQGEISPFVRWSAADALGRLGPVATKAEPELREALQDDSVEVRIHAAAALIRLKLGKKEAWAMLLDGLTNPATVVRERTIQLLQNLGPTLAGDALPALRELAQDPEPEIRRAAWYAVQRLEKK
jgi:HEAT repeat protein